MPEEGRDVEVVLPVLSGTTPAIAASRWLAPSRQRARG
jgi:hypothetical protein